MIRKSCLSIAAPFFVIIYVLCTKSEAMKKTEMMDYLYNFGHMKTRDGNAMTEGMKHLQRTAGITVTGIMDEATERVMEMPRCALVQQETLKGLFHGSRWKTTNITYNIIDYPNHIDKKQVDTEITRAFDEWSKHVDIIFFRENSRNALIQISFSYRPFMANMNADMIAGRSNYPIQGGDIFLNPLHFNGSTPSCVNIYHVVLHEIGHSLGLLHSSYPNSIMSPYLCESDTVILHPNDKKKINLLYKPKSDNATKELEVSHSDRTTPEEQSSICKLSKFDAIVNFSENEIYVFNGHQYWLLEAWTENVLFSLEYPKNISDNWKELPGNVDTAYVDLDGLAYFFKGNQYWKYNGNQLESGYPKNISDDFPGIPHDIDAAMLWEDDNIYFFKGSGYWKFNPSANPPITKDYPKPISRWGNIPNNLDAALYFHNFNANTYFFKDMVYYRYQETEEQTVIRRFPRPTIFWWFNC